MKALLIVACLFVTPLNWIFLHLSNWLMAAHSRIVIELMKRTRLEE